MRDHKIYPPERGDEPMKWVGSVEWTEPYIREGDTAMKPINPKEV